MFNLRINHFSFRTFGRTLTFLSCFYWFSLVGTKSLTCGTFAAYDHIPDKFNINLDCHVNKNIFRGRHFYYSPAPFFLNCVCHMHVYIYIYACSVACNGSAVKLTSRLWGFYFLCSANSPSLRYRAVLFFPHFLLALKWSSSSRTGTFNQQIGLVCCYCRARCKIGWLLMLGRELRQGVEEMVLSK